VLGKKRPWATRTTRSLGGGLVRWPRHEAFDGQRVKTFAGNEPALVTAITNTNKWLTIVF
jgi:hypothetical protein